MRLQNNTLAKLTDDVDKMKALKELNISGNRLKYPPQEVCEEGLPGILKYIEHQKKLKLKATKVS